MTGTRDADLVALRKLADEMAKKRSERVTTGHVLAAIATTSGGAADLLKERKLDAEVLLKAARIMGEEDESAVSRALQRARELAARSPQREVTAIHVLFALLQERKTAAFQAITQCGSDVTKLRTAAMQIAMGIVSQRRVTAAVQLPLAAAPASSPPPSSPRASAMAPSPAPMVVPVRMPAPAPMPVQARPKRHRAPVPSSAANPAARFELDPKRFPTLCALGRNLTAAAARGELDPVFGREAEIDRTLDVLAKRHGNCPCVVGTAGVGKTSVVRGLAPRIAEGRDVATLDDRIVVEIGASGCWQGPACAGPWPSESPRSRPRWRAPRVASCCSSTSCTRCSRATRRSPPS